LYRFTSLCVPLGCGREGLQLFVTFLSRSLFVVSCNGMGSCYFIVALNESVTGDLEKASQLRGLRELVDATSLTEIQLKLDESQPQLPPPLPLLPNPRRIPPLTALVCVFEAHVDCQQIFCTLPGPSPTSTSGAPATTMTVSFVDVLIRLYERAAKAIKKHTPTVATAFEGNAAVCTAPSTMMAIAFHDGYDRLPGARTDRAALRGGRHAGLPSLARVHQRHRPRGAGLPGLSALYLFWARLPADRRTRMPL